MNIKQKHSLYCPAQILKNGETYYSLVIAVAKRAREISLDAEEDKVIITEKPVMTAINEFARGKYKIVENDRIKGKLE